MDPLSIGSSTLKQQLYALGQNHVGFNARAFPNLGCVWPCILAPFPGGEADGWGIEAPVLRSHICPRICLRLTVVGGRPFSRGGSLFKRWGEESPLWQLLYGISGYDNSARLIHKRATEQPADLALVLLGEHRRAARQHV